MFQESSPSDTGRPVIEVEVFGAVNVSEPVGISIVSCVMVASKVPGGIDIHIYFEHTDGRYHHSY